MRPQSSPIEDGQQDLFRVELVKIIDPSHPLVKLSSVVDWGRLSGK